MQLTREQRCLLWLSNAEIAAGRVGELLETYESAEAIWDAFETPSGPKFQPVSKEKLKRLHSDAAMDDHIATLSRSNVRLLFRDDPRYPYLLDVIPDAPYLLYAAGHLECLEMPGVAVVGTRHASEYGRQMSAMIARGMCEEGVCVVSGLARGIDAAAHEAVVNAGGATIGVLGSGINVPYPPEHRGLLRRIAGGKGLILSEYPLDSGPIAFHFPHRNRIIAGLSMGVVFVEGRIKSGGMLTVSAALTQGREVFAVPGRVGTAGAEGPHTILREGARIVTSARDVLEDLSLSPLRMVKETDPCVDATEPQARIIKALQVEPLMVDELAVQTGLSADQVLGELGMMEIMGQVIREAGNRFALPVSR